MKQHYLNQAARLTLVHDLLLELAEEYGWRLQAWAVLSNHYHFVAHSPDKPATLPTFLSKLHTLSARELNQSDAAPGRRVWFQYFDSHISFQRSYLARLHYVHQNPVHHRVVQCAMDWPWCSARWFAQNADTAFQKTIQRFKTDRLNVLDQFEAIKCEVVGLAGEGMKP
ncbi:MAG: transposase [Verrucomicrobiota bacterium]